MYCVTLTKTCTLVILLLINLRPLFAKDVCRDGTYRNLIGPRWVDGCPGFSLCPAGFFCVDQKLAPCPAGRYNDISGSSKCKLCPAGYICPQVFDATSPFQLLGSLAPEACGGFSVYCPAGAWVRTPVQPGFYTIGGGEDGRNRHSEAIAPIGYYAQEGKTFACPPGRYGSRPGLRDATCSGTCSAGYYCNAGSTTPKQHACGSKLLYCPEGSSAPLRVKLPGRNASVTVADASRPAMYTVDRSLDDSKSSIPFREKELICPVGHFCVAGARKKCPAGRFGDREGQHSPLCSGQCRAGYFCPEGSIKNNQLKCGEDFESPESVYCPKGSAEPILADAGHFTSGDSLATRSAQHPCPPGSFCRSGTSIPCPQGRYGARSQSVDPTCDGPCAPGYFCPDLGSTKPTMFRCGQLSQSPAAVYCPIGSVQPLPVDPGYRTVRLTSGDLELNVSAWTAEAGPAAGRGQIFLTTSAIIRNHLKLHEGGLSESDRTLLDSRVRSVLNAGSGSAGRAVSMSQVTTPFFARAEGFANLHHDQFFIVENTHVASKSPDPSPFSLLAVENGPLDLQTHQVACSRGHFCIEGLEFPCPPGRYGSVPNLQNATCSGLCSAGYICPSGSVSSEAQQCGSEEAYCPEGSSQPKRVPPGFLGAGLSPTLQYQVVSCHLGSFCKQGVATQCPPGRYGNTTALETKDCSGECDAGYFCPPGSTNPRAKRCQGPEQFCPAGSGLPVTVTSGFYSVGGRIRPTPAAFLSSDAQEVCFFAPTALDAVPSTTTPQLFSQNLDVLFNASRYCRSAQTGDWDERKNEKPCPPGSFCVAGLRYECPPGRFGSTRRSSRPQCDGPCHAGYYCPWGSTSPQENECGGPDRFCPEKSGAPQPVRTGFYSDEASPLMQRRLQTICPPGHFCVGGMRYPCSPGRYGASEGLHSEQCSGLCSAGFYCPDSATVTNKAAECGSSAVFCPPGSFEPTPVPRGTYSVGGFEQRIGISENTTRTSWRNCPPGHFCSEGKLFQCPGGFWGNKSNEFRPTCSGPCAEGHFCPPGSLSSTAFKCGEVFLEREIVDPNTTRTVGPSPFVNVFTFAADGAIAGGASGGGLTGATQAWIKSISSELLLIQAYIAAGATSNDGRFAEIQTRPLTVAAVEERKKVIQAQLLMLQLGGMRDNVTIPWESGYQIKVPAVDLKVGDYELLGFRLINGGSAVFCPTSSSFPRSVSTGHFSVPSADPFNRTQVSQVKCPPGSYCVAGIRYPCAPGRYGSDSALTSRFCTAACPAGYACPLGSAEPIECEDGTYSGGGMNVCSSCPQDPPELQMREKAIHDHTFGSANPNVDRKKLYRQERCKTSRLCCGQ